MDHCINKLRFYRATQCYRGLRCRNSVCLFFLQTFRDYVLPWSTPRPIYWQRHLTKLNYFSLTSIFMSTFLLISRVTGDDWGYKIPHSSRGSEIRDPQRNRVDLIRILSSNLTDYKLRHFATFLWKPRDLSFSLFVTIHVHSRHRRQADRRQTTCHDNSRTLQ